MENSTGIEENSLQESRYSQTFILGLSLMELLVLITITAIIVALGVPSFISYLQRNRLTSTTLQQYYALQFARAEAVKRNTAIYVSFRTGDNWCYGINAGSTCNCLVSSGCNLGVFRAAKTQQLSLSTSGVSGSSLQFEPTHGAVNASATLTFTVYGESTSMSIKVGRLGNLTLCSSYITGYQSCS